MTSTLIDYAVVAGLLLLSLLAGIFRRRIFHPVENWMVRGEAWSILSDPGEKGSQNERRRSSK